MLPPMEIMKNEKYEKKPNNRRGGHPRTGRSTSRVEGFQLSMLNGPNNRRANIHGHSDRHDEKRTI